MARYKDAEYKPIPLKGRKTMATYNRLGCHVAASEADSLFGYFSRAGEDSHFYVKRGTKYQLENGLPADCEQYVDTKYRANADLSGNDATISVETQGGANRATADTEPWDAAQILRLALIYAWAVETHGIAVKIASDSKIGESSWGLSWHRLGVNGNFPALPDIRAGRNQRGGGMKYSNHFGKLCPGGGKIKQISSIFKLAQDFLTDEPRPSKPSTPPTASKPSKPKPTPIETDGVWGSDTTRRAQQVAGTPVDGLVSAQPRMNRQSGLTSGWHWVGTATAQQMKGSALIREMQSRLKKRKLYRGALDGFAGPQFWAAFQRVLGTPVDGEIWNPSEAVKQFQKNLNEGKLW